MKGRGAGLVCPECGGRLDPRTSNPLGACTHCWEATDVAKALRRRATRERVQQWRQKKVQAAEAGSEP